MPGISIPPKAIADKISAVLLYLDRDAAARQPRRALGQRSRGDLNDDLQAIAQEIVRGGYLSRVHIGLDYFDASINRVAAWVIGARNTLRALLMALLEPIEQLRKLEERAISPPAWPCWKSSKACRSARCGIIFCLKQGVPVGAACMDEVKQYEKKELSRRT